MESGQLKVKEGKTLKSEVNKKVERDAERITGWLPASFFKREMPTQKRDKEALNAERKILNRNFTKVKRKNCQRNIATSANTA
jgi:hypothetical protein